MRPLVEHTDLGAYVLGALSETESEAFEAHLMDCAECQGELKSFAPLPDLLDQVSVPKDNVLTGLLDRVGRERRKRKRSWLVAAAAAVVLIVAGPLVTWSVLSADQWSEYTTTSALSARKGDVWANLTVDGVPWGTGVHLELGGVTGPLSCGLYAVTKSGETRTMMDWTVPPYGYGVPSQPKPLVANGMVALQRADIARYVVRTSDGRDLVILEP
ncbi:anti-sigma factor [Allokutzneria sp. NRRL B-24872]|uniref:anti-sigma factor family protein n=1 Tax=Allokutzneria sp. NRRL B-24872 TaxID=1137961 RepID=UPI000A364AF2|nr:zf-HC2 domain-containing protein [Allokutzneria sp. NRRL B-24872]